jgi:cytochrome c peroxidase
MDLFSFDRSKNSLLSGSLKGLRTFTVAISAFTVLGLASCSEDTAPGTITENKPDQPIVHPVDFPPVIHPADNQPTADKIELGRRLFYDKRMSMYNTHSCGTCHEADNGFAVPTSVLSDKRGAQARQAMAVINVAYNKALLWDSTFSTLEEQIEGPFNSSHEFAQAPELAVAKLQADNDPIYKDLFRKAYGDENITFDRIRKAISTFERTFISGNSPFDLYNRGNTSALTEAQIRGRNLFMDTSETNCSQCHTDYNLTDGHMHSTGLEQQYSDGGLETLTGRGEDNGKFKTPTLRNIRQTGPYMHDGRFATLKQVINHYNEGGRGSKNQDKFIRPLHLTDSEMEDLREFLESLSDQQFLTRKDLQDPWR